jgi:hypothetical protein
MNDRVAIRADRTKILDRIYYVRTASVRYGFQVVNVDIPGGGFTVGFSE